MDRVYFFHDRGNGLLKIGYSADPEKRLRAIRTANPSDIFPLGTLPGGREAERRTHRIFAEHRRRGEWFDATDEVLRTVRAMLLRRGAPCTVHEELARRDGCRYGLKGVEVAVAGLGLTRYEVAGTRWGRDGKLLLEVFPFGTKEARTGGEPKVLHGGYELWTLRELCKATFRTPEGAIKDVPAASAYLMGDWPVVCRCWCPEFGPV